MCNFTLNWYKESLNSRQNISDEKLKSRYESKPVKVRWNQGSSGEPRACLWLG